MPAPASPLTAHGHVLVVDDDEGIRRMCAAILVDAGYDVDVAEDGERAWKAMLNSHYDLVLTDYVMPKTSGYALIRRMRVAQMPQPAILMSGTPEAIEAHTNDPWQRIDAVLRKPFSRDRLLSTAGSLLGGREAAESAPSATGPAWSPVADVPASPV